MADVNPVAGIEKDGNIEQMMQVQAAEDEFKQLQKYLEQFDEQLGAIRNLVEALNDFAKLNSGEKMLSPIANGIFVESNLANCKEVLINVGNGVIVKKSVPDAIKLLSGQEGEVSNMRSQTLVQLEELMKKINSSK